MVLLNRPYRKLGRSGIEIWASKEWGDAHNFRRVYAGAYDFYADFCVVFNNLER